MATVEEETGLVIDLTALSARAFADLDEPVTVDVEADFGAVEVIVPRGISIDVDAETDPGSTEVFGRNDDGFSAGIEADSGEEVDVELTVALDVGAIEVRRP